MVIHDEIKNEIASSVIAAITSLGAEAKIEDIYRPITIAPNLDMGHFAFPCFQFAKALKDNPANIAKKISEKIEDVKFVKEFKAVGPYLNFFIDMNQVSEQLFPQIKEGKFFDKTLVSHPQKSMVEYFQPNTHKEVHVGHMRNLCLGESVINILRYSGHPIVAATYPGDSGAHVAKVLWYIKKFTPKFNEADGNDKGEWLGGIYSAANQMLEKERGTDKEDQNRVDLTNILKEIHNESGEYYDLWKETRQWSLDHMKDICDWAGVEFEEWYFESEVDAPSLTYAQELYEKGILVKDDGAIGMNLKDDKLGFCLLIKSDGNGLYATKDIELARKKFEEGGIQKSIYVVDKRQSYHFKQVFKTLEKIGFEQAKDCYHLEYEFVTLPDGALSSRKGNIISAKTLISAMENEIKERYLSRYDDWSEEEKNSTATMVAKGAIKYAMVNIETNKEIVFNMDEWLKLDGESGPYIQYAHARIKSLMNKIEIGSTAADYSQMTTKSEAALLLKLTQFNNIVESASENFKVSHLTTYLYELAKLYSSFYSECSINNAETEKLKAARLELSSATAIIIQKGLQLIGIPAPERM